MGWWITTSISSAAPPLLRNEQRSYSGLGIETSAYFDFTLTIPRLTKQVNRILGIYLNFFRIVLRSEYRSMLLYKVKHFLRHDYVHSTPRSLTGTGKAQPWGPWQLCQPQGWSEKVPIWSKKAPALERGLGTSIIGIPHYETGANLFRILHIIFYH